MMAGKKGKKMSVCLTERRSQRGMVGYSSSSLSSSLVAFRSFLLKDSFS